MPELIVSQGVGECRKSPVHWTIVFSIVLFTIGLYGLGTMYKSSVQQLERRIDVLEACLNNLHLHQTHLEDGTFVASVGCKKP